MLSASAKVSGKEVTGAIRPDVDEGKDSGIGVEEKCDSESFKERSSTKLHWLLQPLVLNTRNIRIGNITDRQSGVE
ncbi:hypothetical protein NPIL_114831 [Nephila pilipes]|uniref:Uncharacterized protein n=1 Tax=Nephila pilipes TaxID=299642 RepID=A0A8X6IJF2_NEPPI|nr:hypothetical protein NPIL_114831 [Nephila pilipes]